MASLNEVQAKFQWASQHLKRFHTESNEFLRRQPRPYDIAPNRYVENGETFEKFTIDIHSGPPRELALILGDFLHNARAALDYLALALTETNLGQAANSNLRRDTAFPIASMIEEFDPRKVRAVAPEVFTIIEGLQPYHGSDPLVHPLAVLRQMSNIDKHRSLHLTFLSVKSGGWWGETVELVRATLGPLDDDAEVALFRWQQPPEPEVEMDAQFDIQVGVTNSEGAIVDLDIMERWTRNNVIRALMPYLKS